MNILFSTTCQWNVGDEIILRGVKNLLAGQGLSFNSIAWNRHPEIRPHNYSKDNSFDVHRHRAEDVDLVVFAGTPEWMGKRVDPLNEMISTCRLPCLYLGIGYTQPEFPLTDAVRSAMQSQARLITCRDETTCRNLCRELVDRPVHLLPCPSIFHARQPRLRKDLRRIGVIYQTVFTKYQAVTSHTRRTLLAAIWALSRRHPVNIICNYVDEWSEASSLFGSDVVRYSHSVDDYEGFFQEVDVVVGARVHGCLGAFGAGTPAVLLEWEDDLRRRGVAEQIPLLQMGPTHDPAGLVNLIESLDVSAASSRALEFIGAQRQIYDNLLSTVNLPRLGSSTTWIDLPTLEARVDELTHQRKANEQSRQSGTSAKRTGIEWLKEAGSKVVGSIKSSRSTRH